MIPPTPSIDPTHEIKRAALSRGGGAMLLLGGLTLLVGFGIFISTFFMGAEFARAPFENDQPQITYSPEIQGHLPVPLKVRTKADIMGAMAFRSVLGLVLFGAGGLMLVIGVGSFGLGNIGRLLRYQAGESVPVIKDIARDVAPTTNELTRGVAHAVRQGWDGRSSPPPDGRACPSCQAENPPDARFCNHCGTQVAS